MKKRIMAIVTLVVIAVTFCAGTIVSSASAYYSTGNSISDFLNTYSMNYVCFNNVASPRKCYYGAYTPMIPVSMLKDGSISGGIDNNNELLDQSGSSTFYRDSVNAGANAARFEASNFSITPNSNYGDYDGIVTYRLKLYDWGNGRDTVPVTTVNVQYNDFVIRNGDRDLYTFVLGCSTPTSGVTLQYTASINLTYPVKDNNGVYRYITRQVVNSDTRVMPSANTIMGITMGIRSTILNKLPSAFTYGDVYVNSLTISLTTTDNVLLSDITVGQPITIGDFPTLADMFDDSIKQPSSPVYVNNSFVDWLGTTAWRFFNFRIFGSAVTLGAVFIAILGVFIICMIFKYFAGG